MEVGERLHSHGRPGWAGPARALVRYFAQRMTHSRTREWQKYRTLDPAGLATIKRDIAAGARPWTRLLDKLRNTASLGRGVYLHFVQSIEKPWGRTT